MAEHDMPEAIGLRSAGLFLLNRELILELCRQEMESTWGQRPTAQKAVGRSTKNWIQLAFCIQKRPSQGRPQPTPGIKNPVIALKTRATTGLKIAF